jgi:RNA polymerase sigma factor (TIGR02999 family)
MNDVTPATIDLTQLLLDWDAGNASALDRLMPLVAAELHRRASRYFRRERNGHTLQPTALVNEVYLRLVDHQRVGWKNRSHFFAIAARILRRILVDHARRRHAAKRGDTAVTLSEELVDPRASCDLDLVGLDDALTELAELEPRQCRVIELRFFGGLTIKETAEALDMSPATVKLDWNMARAWLFNKFKGR